MAKKKHLETIKKGPHAWNKWRAQHPKATPDLREANLKKADLRGADLSEAKLNGANLGNADLSGADLRRADLNDADLAEADLRRANLGRASLKRADLRRANVKRANLRKADLRQANLRRADLGRADLSDADLSEAVLTKADLSEADVRDANLSRATVGETSFEDIDLSVAKGLETVVHTAPSVLSIGTIYQSLGKIPDEFLRGLGVPDDFITHIPLLVEQTHQYRSCFISYSHTDKAFARKLYDGLRRKGIRCGWDDRDFAVGKDLFDAADSNILQWDKVLLCASEASLTSWWVNNEITMALEKEHVLMEKGVDDWRVVIPLDLDGFLPKWRDGKASQIKVRTSADFKGWDGDEDRFEQQFERLVQSLRTGIR